ncbi:MAG: hypothetical protein ACPIOQ_31880, partial [Promethearchaeia archaeon]
CSLPTGFSRARRQLHLPEVYAGWQGQRCAGNGGGSVQSVSSTCGPSAKVGSKNANSGHAAPAQRG